MNTIDNNATALLPGSHYEVISLKTKDSPTGADTIIKASPVTLHADKDNFNDEADCELTPITTHIDSTKCPRSQSPIFCISEQSPTSFSYDSPPPRTSVVDSPSTSFGTPLTYAGSPIDSRMSWKNTSGGSPVMFLTKQYTKGVFGQKFAACLLNKLNFAPLHDPTSDNWSIWTMSSSEKVDFEQLKKMRSWQRFGRFPGSEQLTRKELLWSNIDVMAAKHGNKFNFLPQSFVLPKQYQEFRKECKKASQEGKPTGPWIMKAHTDRNSSDVSIVNNFNDLTKLDSIRMTLQRKKMVISRYIPNPLLIDGLKFDLRFYVLVTSVSPLRVYFFNDGIARFCTDSYSLASTSPLAHITSTSMNSKSLKFEASSDPNETNFGHLRSAKAVFEVLKHNGVDSDKLMKRIHDITIKALIAAQPAVAEQTDKFIPYRRNCFQLFGLDVLVDDTLKPWLIDLNSNPSLEPFCHMEAPLKGKLIADMLRILGLLNEQMPRHMDVPSDLSERETIDVVCTLTENKNSGNFDLIYPAKNYTRYDEFLQIPSKTNQIIVDNIARKSSKSHQLERSSSTFFRMYPTPVPHVPAVPQPTLDRKSTFFRMYPVGGSP